jgi:secondary thiamine-phosphate synthase enzyme
MVQRIAIRTGGQGLYEITSRVQAVVSQAGVREGLCVVLVQHTSASLIIQENADPSAQHDLERWLCRLVPEGDPLFTHTLEGDDDMPAHVKAALTATTLSIPLADGRLALGTWQGIYLWEHRHSGGTRNCVVYVGNGSDGATKRRSDEGKRRNPRPCP